MPKKKKEIDKITASSLKDEHIHRNKQIGYAYLAGLLTFSFSLLLMVLILKPLPNYPPLVYGFVLVWSAFAFGVCAYLLSWFCIDWDPKLGIESRKLIILIPRGN